MTLQYWGAIGVFVGVIMGVVGIVPLGMLASAFHSDWSAVGQLALGLVLTFGARMAAFMVAARMDRDEAGVNSNSWVVAGVVAGVIIVGALSGVVAWDQFVASQTQPQTDKYDTWDQFVAAQNALHPGVPT